MTTKPMSLKNTGTEQGGGQVPGTKKRRWLPWRSIFRWSLALLLVLLISNIGISLWSKLALKRAEQRVADSGESLNFRDFVPPEIPHRENASHYLDAVAALYPVFRKEPWAAPSAAAGERTLKAELIKALDRLDEDYSRPGEEELDLFRAGLNQFDIQYRLFDEARHLEKARFDTHYSSNLPISNEVPRITPRLNLANLLEARALLAMHEGRTEDAYRDAADIFRLARWVGMEAPALFTKVFATDIVRFGCRTVNQLMRDSPPGPEAVERIREEADRLEPGTMFRRGLLFERAANFSTLVDPDFQHTPYRPYYRLSAAKYLDGMSLAISDAAPPAYQRDPGLLDDDAQVERYAPGLLGLTARMMMDNCQWVSHRRDAMLVQLDLLSLALRLEDYHRENGTFPGRLDQLNGPQPVDLFSGGPYRYQTVDGGYNLYSVSGNLTDDGGSRAKSPRRSLMEGDLVWRVRP